MTVILLATNEIAAIIHNVKAVRAFKGNDNDGDLVAVIADDSQTLDVPDANEFMSGYKKALETDAKYFEFETGLDIPPATVLREAFSNDLSDDELFDNEDAEESPAS